MTTFILCVICCDSDPRLSWETPSKKKSVKKKQKKTFCLLGVGVDLGGGGLLTDTFEWSKKICLAGIFPAKRPLNRLTPCEWISWTPKYKPETESNYCLAQRRDREQWRLIYKGNVTQCWEPLRGRLWNCSVSAASARISCPSWRAAPSWHLMRGSFQFWGHLCACVPAWVSCSSVTCAEKKFRDIRVIRTTLTERTGLSTARPAEDIWRGFSVWSQSPLWALIISFPWVCLCAY